MKPGAEALMAALPHVMAAPRAQGAIHQLCHRPGRGLRSFPDSLTLTQAQGVPGDRWLTEPWLRLPDGRADPDIQVSILPARVRDLVWQPGDADLHPGDTMIADMNLSTANLPPGTLLQAGTAVLRVSSLFNDGCVKWKTRYGAAAKEWITAPGHPELRLRGILCAIVQDGAVGLGDTLHKIV
jgi:hypothetical protein